MCKQLVELEFHTKGRNMSGKVVFKISIGNSFQMSAVDNRNQTYDISFFRGNRPLDSDMFKTQKGVKIKTVQKLLAQLKSFNEEQAAA